MQVATFSTRGLAILTLATLFWGPLQGWGAEPAPAGTEPPPALTTPPPTVTKPHTLKSFQIVGAKSVRLQDLRKELSVQLPWLLLFWKKPPTFRPVDLDYDVERLKRFYRRQGFYHAKITPEIQYLPDGAANVKLIIEEGPPVLVTAVEVKVDNGLDLSELQSKWPLKVGDRFTEKAYDGLKNLFLNYLPNHGYPRVKVKGRIMLDEEKNTAAVFLTVNPGAQAYFGVAAVKDQDKLETPAKAILEKLTFKEGDLFSLDELYKTQRRLYATDLFKSVVLTPEEVAPQERHIPISIQLEEKKKRGLKLGLGYGDEDKIRARVGVRYRNLWGGGRVLELDSRYSTLGYLVTETLTNPVVWGSNFDFVQQSGARHRDLPGFTDQAYFTQARLEHDLGLDFRYYFGYGLEFSRPFSIPIETLIRLQGTESEKVYRASFMLLGLRRDTVDNPIAPTKGSTVTFNNEVAPTFLGSALQYAQTILEAKKYHSLGDSGVVLAGRAKFGIIEPMQATAQIPIQKRFFSGGANSVRGYKLDFLGPRNASNDPIGGDAVLEASLEARFPLPLPLLPEAINNKIGGVVFMDAGNVYFKVKDIDPGQIRYSPGFGVRYLSPIGPIGVDVAFPVNRLDDDRKYQIHFTIGYGF